MSDNVIVSTSYRMWFSFPSSAGKSTRIETWWQWDQAACWQCRRSSAPRHFPNAPAYEPVNEYVFLGVKPKCVVVPLGSYFIVAPDLGACQSYSAWCAVNICNVSFGLSFENPSTILKTVSTKCEFSHLVFFFSIHYTSLLGGWCQDFPPVFRGDNNFLKTALNF